MGKRLTAVLLLVLVGMSVVVAARAAAASSSPQPVSEFKPEISMELLERLVAAEQAAREPAAPPFLSRADRIKQCQEAKEAAAGQQTASEPGEKECKGPKCEPSGPACGNGICEPGENCKSCGTDCGRCQGTCGDGICEFPLEDKFKCSADCPCQELYCTLSGCRVVATCPGMSTIDPIDLRRLIGG